MNSSERIELFQRELSYIADNKVKEFAKILLENADDYFFEVPASSSGKYHPDFARGNGGLVRHTKAVVYFLNEYLRPNIEFDEISRYEADLLIVAAIAHDIKKQGDGSEGHTVKEHPQLAVDYINAMWNKYDGKKYISEDSLDYLCDAVLTHMGPWTPNPPKTLPQKLVFYADYTASRKEITGISFIDNGDVAPVEAYEKPVYTLEGYKFDFGKLKGMTIKEAYDKNPGYLEWMVGVADFGHPEVQELARNFLNSL